jgi:hypothetical protein
METLLRISMFAFASLSLFGALSAVYDIGRARKPISHGTAIASIIVSALVSAGCVYVAFNWGPQP